MFLLVIGRLETRFEGYIFKLNGNPGRLPHRAFVCIQFPVDSYTDQAVRPSRFSSFDKHIKYFIRGYIIRCAGAELLSVLHRNRGNREVFICSLSLWRKNPKTAVDIICIVNRIPYRIGLVCATRQTQNGAKCDNSTNPKTEYRPFQNLRGGGFIIPTRRKTQAPTEAKPEASFFINSRVKVFILTILRTCTSIRDTFRKYRRIARQKADISGRDSKNSTVRNRHRPPSAPPL